VGMRRRLSVALVPLSFPCFFLLLFFFFCGPGPLFVSSESRRTRDGDGRMTFGCSRNPIFRMSSAGELVLPILWVEKDNIIDVRRD
jgi:hypothetical protein